MNTRRSLLVSAATLVASTMVPRAWAKPTTPAATLQAALESSDLIYLSPLHKSGKESRCHAEIWFVQKSGVVYVVTANTAWRAKAISRGLDRARLWAGDVGPVKGAGDCYRNAPMFVAKGAHVTDAKEIESVLDLYGSKYRVSWLLWSSKFHNGLKDGSRVMLRYTREA